MLLNRDDEKLYELIRSRPIPEFLYRYRAMLSCELKKIFQQRKVILNNPLNFNDPFECRPALVSHKNVFKRELFVKGLPGAELRKFDKQAYTKAKKKAVNELTNPDKLKQIYVNFLRTIGIYCLSEKNNDLLMWSHYSDFHQGLCLEFKTTQNTFFWEAFPVIYQNEYPIVNAMDFGKPEEFRKALLTKYSEWQYEFEWRILKMEQDGGPGDYSFSPELLSGIILGSRIRDEDKEKVREWIKNYPTKISIYKARLNESKYQLDIVKIDEI
jgi:hypothetical protein